MKWIFRHFVQVAAAPILNTLSLQLVIIHDLHLGEQQAHLVLAERVDDVL